MKPSVMPLAAILTACSLATASAASDPSATPASPSTQKQGTPWEPSSPDNKIVDDLIQKYVEAYNRGDAKAVANLFADNIDYIDSDGVEREGRDAIEQLLADDFQANPGAKLDIRIDEVSRLTPDVLVDRGVATVTPATGAADATHYVAIHVRKGDRWEIAQLTETASPPPTASSELRALEWLVGTWQDQGGDQSVQTTIRWAGDNNFLTRTFKAKGADQDEVDGWEIIGWDPDREQIRSWIFDSGGGFGESEWTYDGEHWLIKASNVLPDGSHSTAENVLTKIDDQKFTWESQNRTLDGELEPSLDKVEVRRVSETP
jgi:uncharacterized protein (TIGR02246 family)